MKQYYKTIKVIGDTSNIAYWETTDPARARNIFSSFNFDLILPLGNKRPRNVPKEYFQQI